MAAAAAAAGRAADYGAALEPTAGRLWSRAGDGASRAGGRLGLWTSRRLPLCTAVAISTLSPGRS